MPKPPNTQHGPDAPPTALVSFFRAIRKMALTLDALEASEKDICRE